MDLEYWLSNYGYIAVLIGTFLEGETILVLGGFAAHNGYLWLPGVLIAAFCGSFGGDQLYFFIGRRQGRKFLAKRPNWQARINRVYVLLERYHTLFILGFRFLYGLRTVTPFVLGTTDLKTSRYFFLNMIGAIVWAVGIGCAGYVFGEAVMVGIEHAKQYQAYILGGLAVAAVVFFVVTQIRKRRRPTLVEAVAPTPPESVASSPALSDAAFPSDAGRPSDAHRPSDSV